MQQGNGYDILFTKCVSQFMWIFNAGGLLLHIFCKFERNEFFIQIIDNIGGTFEE